MYGEVAQMHRMLFERPLQNRKENITLPLGGNNYDFQKIHPPHLGVYYCAQNIPLYTGF